MKIFHKYSIATAFTLSFGLALASTTPAYAATSPSLGTAATYGVLADTFNYNVGLTTITGTLGTSALGYVGVFPGGGATLTVIGDTEVNNAARTQAGLDQNAALNNVVDGLNTQVCTSLGAAISLNAIDIDGAGPLPPGTFIPGCYSSTGTMSITTGTTVTLSGAGTYIFRPTGALLPEANSIVNLVGASACDVFWAPTAATTIGANATFAGTIIDAAGITIGNTVSWTGRALAYGGTITADTDTITVPSCATPPGGGGRRVSGTINVVKTVVNDSGGTSTVASFPLFVNGTLVVSGETNSFGEGQFTVTETSSVNYTQTFSGDCDASGIVNLSLNQNAFCIVTNNDIGPPLIVPPVPPLIDVVKVPSPLALPAGPGPVQYTYTVRNIGPVAMTDVTMVGDTCSPIVLFSGDVNDDDILQVSETWVYRCSTTLTETHTNTIVATGWANGISAIDIASATVVVGAPIVPPLIHVTKTPRPLRLLSGAGMVTYIARVTNPGTVALSNVTLVDDKCRPMRFITGDRDGDSMLDSGETWNYICRTRLTSTTTNTVTATGQANGFTVRDIAVATVVVAAPAPRPAAPILLPNTGFNPYLRQ